MVRHIAPGLSKEIDEQALRLYLDAGYVPAPLSIHESIRKLPAHTDFRKKHGGSREATDTDFSMTIEPNLAWARRSEDDLLDELDEIISRSVKLRMISDVPLGAFLSGGIDSFRVAMMQNMQSCPWLVTFTQVCLSSGTTRAFMRARWPIIFLLIITASGSGSTT